MNNIKSTYINDSNNNYHFSTILYLVLSIFAYLNIKLIKKGNKEKLLKIQW